MPTTEITNAVKKAESIRQHAESNDFDNIAAGKTFNMTVSIGVASLYSRLALFALSFFLSLKG